MISSTNEARRVVCVDWRSPETTPNELLSFIPSSDKLISGVEQLKPDYMKLERHGHFMNNQLLEIARYLFSFSRDEVRRLHQVIGED